MSTLDFLLMTFMICALWFITNEHMDITTTKVIAAIEDNGCTSPFEMNSVPQTNQTKYNFGSGGLDK
jgi:hypothetical protein